MWKIVFNTAVSLSCIFGIVPLLGWFYSVAMWLSLGGAYPKAVGFYWLYMGRGMTIVGIVAAVLLAGFCVLYGKIMKAAEACRMDSEEGGMGIRLDGAEELPHTRCDCCSGQFDKQ